jgi:outer membrane murein-binding lipoprotein Lpp
MKTTLGMRATLLGSGAALALIASPAFAGQVDDLKSQIDQLQTQLDQLEQQKAQGNGGEAVDPNAEANDDVDDQGQPKKRQYVKAQPDFISPGAADAVVGGDIPRSFKLPGSDTSVSIKMLIKADFIYDFDQQVGDSFQFFQATPKGIVQADGESQNKTGQFRFDARYSRLTFETRTPTDYGPLSTFIDADFWGGTAGPGGGVSGGAANSFVTNSYAFQLRDAFATLGPVLVGQTLSNAVDPEAFGELLDNFAPPGTVVTQQAQVRYTQNWGKFSFSASAENPQSDFTQNINALTATGSPSPLAGNYGSGFSIEKMPDFTAALSFGDSWGHVRVSGLLRREGASSGVSPAAGVPSFDVGAIGGGGIVSGSLNLGALAPFFGNDTAGAQGYFGSGMGRYIIFGGGLYQGAELKLNAAGTSWKMVTLPEEGGFAWYQHNWTDTLRSTVDFGIAHTHWGTNAGDTTNAAVSIPTLQSDLLAAAYVNLLWSPLKQTTFGLEFMYAHKVLRSGDNDITPGGLTAHVPGDVDVKRLMAEMIFSF